MRQKTKKSFECAILRDRYLKKASGVTDGQIKTCMPMIFYSYNRAIKQFGNAYRAAGLNEDDVLGLAMSHAYAFLGNFSFDKNPKQRERAHNKLLAKGNGEPTDSQMLKEEGKIMINFLLQGLRESARLSYKHGERQKVPVIGTAQNFVVPKGMDISDELIASKYKEMGIEKITLAQIKEIKDGGENWVEKEGMEIRTINAKTRPLMLEEYFSAYLGLNQDGYPSPEDEALDPAKNMLARFVNMSPDEQREALQKVSRKKSHRKLANKLLEKLEAGKCITVADL